jgi:hypothetical protein
MWLPWDWAMAIAIGLLVAVPMLRSAQRRWLVAGAAFAQEAALVFALYAIWQLAGDLAVNNANGAMAHGRWIWDFEQAWHFPSEVTLQRQILGVDWLVQAANVFYATVHAPALVVFLLWLFIRHRDDYATWRNTLAVGTAACLLLQLWPAAPPRLYPELGFVDTGIVYHQSVYGPMGQGLSSQLQAMPSVHVAWAVLIGVAVVMVSRSRWRWFVLLHPIATIWVVVVTANHWWLDGIVAVVFLVLAFALDRGVRWVMARVRPDRTALAPQVV